VKDWGKSDVQMRGKERMKKGQVVLKTVVSVVLRGNMQQRANRKEWTPTRRRLVWC
jgi:hypothetical protein